MTLFRRLESRILNQYPTFRVPRIAVSPTRPQEREEKARNRDAARRRIKCRGSVRQASAKRTLRKDPSRSSLGRQVCPRIVRPSRSSFGRSNVWLNILVTPEKTMRRWIGCAHRSASLDSKFQFWRAATATVVDGHLRFKAARKLGSWPGGDITGIPVSTLRRMVRGAGEGVPADGQPFRGLGRVG